MALQSGDLVEDLNGLASPSSTTTDPSRGANQIAGVNTKDDIEPLKVAAKRPASPDADDTDTEEEEQSPQRKPRKRVKTRASRRKRGKLRQLTETPLDILFEIFSYLEPFDLLRLSRTTKTLRKLLMSRETAFVWECARLGTDGLPRMIEGFNEPQYANLLFDSHCHNCLKTPIKTVQWQIRMRLCKECLENGTIMANTKRQLQSHGFTDSLKSRQLLEVTPYYNHTQKGMLTSFYDVSAYERLVKESRSLHHRSSHFMAWLAKKQEEHKALVWSCKEYEGWMASRTETRAAELGSLRSVRLQRIITRLKADGWGEEVKLQSTLKTLRGHPLVKQPRELTDRTWYTIKPTLTKLMSDIRSDLLLQTAISERTRILENLGKTFFATLPETPHNPPASALCVYQPFLNIIKNTPPHKDATSKLKKALNSETVLAICAEWREEQEERLTALLRKTRRNADLSLAVNAFTCVERPGCRVFPSVLHYPHFASHPCFYGTAPVGDTNVTVWTGEGISTLKRDLYTACQGIVRMCGLDPDTATAEDMDGVDVFFRCEYCDDSIRAPVYKMKPVCVMRWRTAMNHHHVDGVSRVDDAELLALGRTRERAMFKDDLRNCQAFVCVHCDMAETSAAARSEHLRSAHGTGGEPTVDHYRRSLKDKKVNKLSVEVTPKAVRQNKDVKP